MRLKAHTYKLQESNVNLKLTLVDTVGYGDQINKNSFGSIVDYIDSQFEAYLPNYHDTRVELHMLGLVPTSPHYQDAALNRNSRCEALVSVSPMMTIALSLRTCTTAAL